MQFSLSHVRALLAIVATLLSTEHFLLHVSSGPVFMEVFPVVGVVGAVWMGGGKLGWFGNVRVGVFGCVCGGVGVGGACVGMCV